MSESTWRWECGKCGTCNPQDAERCFGYCDGRRPGSPPVEDPAVLPPGWTENGKQGAFSRTVGATTDLALRLVAWPKVMPEARVLANGDVEYKLNPAVPYVWTFDLGYVNRSMPWFPPVSPTRRQAAFDADSVWAQIIAKAKG